MAMRQSARRLTGVAAAASVESASPPFPVFVRPDVRSGTISRGPPPAQASAPASIDAPTHTSTSSGSDHKPIGSRQQSREHDDVFFLYDLLQRRPELFSQDDAAEVRERSESVLWSCSSSSIAGNASGESPAPFESPGESPAPSVASEQEEHDVVADPCGAFREQLRGVDLIRQRLYETALML